jgi:hypothetical protein
MVNINLSTGKTSTCIWCIGWVLKSKVKATMRAFQNKKCNPFEHMPQHILLHMVLFVKVTIKRWNAFLTGLSCGLTPLVFLQVHIKSKLYLHHESENLQLVCIIVALFRSRVISSSFYWALQLCQLPPPGPTTNPKVCFQYRIL